MNMKRQNQKKEVSVKFRPDYEAIAKWARMIQKLAVELQEEAEKPKPDINKVLSITNIQIAQLIYQVNRYTLLIPKDSITDF